MQVDGEMERAAIATEGECHPDKKEHLIYRLMHPVFVNAFSMDLYETMIGKDWQEEDLEDLRERDSILIKRAGPVDWMGLQSAAASAQQQQ